MDKPFCADALFIFAMDRRKANRMGKNTGQRKWEQERAKDQGVWKAGRGMKVRWEC